MPTDATKDIEIFRAGTRRAMSGEELSVSVADLADIAACYDPAKDRAPIVVGHPKTNHPAYGWVRSLRVDGDRLVATAEQVDPGFAELVRAGRYKKVSSSFRRTPDGKLSLRHVGYLGAVPPAVKGLKEAVFADADGEILEFSLNPEGGQMPESQTSMAELERRLKEAEAKVEAAERRATVAEGDKQKLSVAVAEFAERERKGKHVADKAKIDALVAVGKILPREVSGLASLVEFLGRDDGVLEFSEGDGTAKVHPKEFLFGLLEKRPKLVEFSEVGAGGADEINFSDPDAILASARALQAKAKAEGREISTTDAILRVTESKGHGL